MHHGWYNAGIGICSSVRNYGSGVSVMFTMLWNKRRQRQQERKRLYMELATMDETGFFAALAGRIK